MDSNDGEIKALREILETQKKRIQALEAHFFRYEEADLNQLAIQGASWYCKEKMRGAPLEQRTMALNLVAHGISMGFRKKEEMMGIAKTGGILNGENHRS